MALWAVGQHQSGAWARNYATYLRQHLGTSTLYKSSLLGRLIAMTVFVDALVGLAMVIR